MGTKTLSISDDAYQRLLGLKQRNESFSQLIQRLTGRQDLMRFAGTITAELAAELAASSASVRKRFDAEWRERTA